MDSVDITGAKRDDVSQNLSQGASETRMEGSDGGREKKLLVCVCKEGRFL